jgi:class 3 adenylate cyclase
MMNVAQMFFGEFTLKGIRRPMMTCNVTSGTQATNRQASSQHV